MISFKRQAGIYAALALTAGTWLAFSKADDATPPVGMMPVADFPKNYNGTPFTDSKYKEGAQKIPGKVMCAYYDLGGEGVAYHDTDAKNKGSGGLNPLDGKYLNEFRTREGVDTSYTKDFADFWEGEAVKPPKDMLYVGWTDPGEWVNYTVDVAEDGDYAVDVLYTSNKGGEISLDVNGKPLDKPITIASTNDPKDTISWRQWHHWNINKDAATVKLSKGRNLLTLHIVKEGNMNIGTLEFKLLADDVGTSKSFHGPVGLVSPYSLRDLQKTQGLAAALDKTRSFGFRYVELGTDFGGLTPAAFKAELDRRGLVPVGQHLSYERIRDDVEGVAAEAKLLNLTRIGCAWIPHKDPFDEKQCRAAAVVFNWAGAALAKHGIQLYYHTHGYEFRPFGQGTIFDLLVVETSPKTLMFEMDVAWVVLPGQDPAELIKKYPDRWLMMHVKDLKKGVPHNHLVKAALTDQVPIGSGQVDWPKLLRSAQEAGLKYYLIEDESPAVLAQIRQSLRYLESVSW